MDDQGNAQLTIIETPCLKTEQDDANVDIIINENTSKIDEIVENSAETFIGLENGDEVITIAAQESVGEVYIYEKNENEENSAEFIQVCDNLSNNAFEEGNNIKESKEAEEVIVDIPNDPSTEKLDEESETGSTENLNGGENLKEQEDLVIADSGEKNLVKISYEKPEENQLKNYKNVILEDWEVEVPQVVENCETKNHVVVEEESPMLRVLEEPGGAEAERNHENGGTKKLLGTDVPEKILLEDSNHKENSSQEPVFLGTDKKLESLKIPKSITKKEIVKILDESTERVVRPIVAKKDLFFSIELTKRLNQKLSLGKTSKSSDSEQKEDESDSCNNNNTVDDRQKIVDILEADEIKDWKSVSNRSGSSTKSTGNDMEISKAIKSMEEVDKGPVKTPRKTPLKKFKVVDKELERIIALQQLREEFPTTRKRSRTTKKVNHIPFKASTVLEKALTSPEVTTALKPGPPRRRPCYLPENISYSKPNENLPDNGEGDKGHKTKKVKDGSDVSAGDKVDFAELENTTVSNSVVKTYSVKRKSTDAENEIKSTIAAVTKALIESAEETNESKPKKQKTVKKSENKKEKKISVKKRKKLKPGVGGDKKRNAELEKLLGDEGAIRMLYETQQGEAGTPIKKPKFKTTSGLKKDLVLKTKLVKNAVMRLSGIGVERVSLRGKRRSLRAKSEASSQEEPLFSSTPNIVLYKPRKKQRAEASRILYRHSSSESFESSEGYRRTSFDVEVPAISSGVVNFENAENVASDFVEAEKPSPKMKLKKSELCINKKVKRKSEKEEKSPKVENDEPPVVLAPKLNLSNVPVRKSSRPRSVSKKYAIWSSTSMDSLSVESLGLKKLKKASKKLGKKLNLKELTILQYEHLVQIILSPVSTSLKNSLNYEVLQELHQVFSYLSGDDSCNTVLLTSQGSTFCQGIDINQLVSLNDGDRKSGISRLVKVIREFIKCLAEFKKPVIAGVQGAAVGLGVTFLPYCDLVICSDKATFYTPYVKMGQAPEGAPTHTFPRVSRQLVSELLFKSHKMTAADALKLGLVTQIIPEDRFQENLSLIARNMAVQPSQGIQSVKFLLKNFELAEIKNILRVEGELLEEHWNSTECLNNMIKFLNSGELQLKQVDGS